MDVHKRESIVVRDGTCDPWLEVEDLGGGLCISVYACGEVKAVILPGSLGMTIEVPGTGEEHDIRYDDIPVAAWEELIGGTEDDHECPF